MIRQVPFLEEGGDGFQEMVCVELVRIEVFNDQERLGNRRGQSEARRGRKQCDAPCDETRRDG